MCGVVSVHMMGVFTCIVYVLGVNICVCAFYLWQCMDG